MMFFDDTKALDETSEHNEESSAYDTSLGEQSQTPESDRTEDQRDQQRCCIYNKKWIPYIIFFNGLIFAIGSGMTVKFFPLFFKDEVRLSPSQVQIVYCIVPIVMAITATIGSKLAGSGFGRVQTMLLFWCLGVSLLFSMVIFKRYLDEHPFTLVPVYVLRTSLVNATYPLTQSVLMDFVPKDERARWKSLDSVAMFGWCGSAFLGGMIADKYDYTHTFLITAIVQSIGTAVGALLLPLVPRNEGGEDEGMVDDEGREHSSIGSASIGGDSNNASLREPLLSSN
jgi:predicted MFS family arabinose efflux permease